MTNGNGESLEYAFRLSKNARSSRDCMEPSAQIALNKIIDELAENPDANPHRITPLSEAGNIYLYTHPNPRIELTYEIDRERKRLVFQHFVVPQFAESRLVFVSYSHNDKEWLERLQKWLSGFEEDDRVRIWSDTEIEAGDDWREEIDNALASARVALLLVSQDFLASKFIKENELPPLLAAREEGKLKILWVAVRDSTFEDTVIERYQAANDPGQPLAGLDDAAQDAVLKQIYKQVKAALEE